MTATRNVKGLLGTKLGMTQVWDENNNLIPVTVVQADSNVVTQLRNADRDGYTAVQIGYGQIDPRKVTKPLAGHFEAAGVTPRRHLVRCRVRSWPGIVRRALRSRPEGRRRWHLQGQGLRRRYEASQLRWRLRFARCSQEPP